MLPEGTGSVAGRIQCQVCGRGLVPRLDGASRPHKPFRGAEDQCHGSGFRLSRWPVGQRLQHYTGQVWEVEAIEDLCWPGYRMRCVEQTIEISRPVGTVEHFNAEYLHRHGWKPLATDLMAALERPLDARRGGGGSR